MKKFLSMALALVMTLSLCTFVSTTQASADFTDAEDLSSQYAVQAADVIQTIEVMDGYDDGSFRPEAGLTRQAAAKIICNMILGPTTARALPTNANPFPDVLAGNQFSGYISYCAQQGIISGYGDGTFRPGDPLSGYAYLKMLLGALGYDANHEGFVGDNWKVNVAKIALGIGLNKGIDEELDGTTQVTREAAAIYAFNTLQADMVEYESKNTLEINGVTVSMGGGNAIPQTWTTSSTSANNINDRKDDGTAGGNLPIVQFAERYFDKLQRFPNQWDTYTQDAFGRPAIRWSWKGVDIDTYPEEADVVYVGNVSANTIYGDLNMGSADNAAELFFNGRAAGRINIARSNGDDIDGLTAMTDGKIGDGTYVEAYHNDANNHVTVCVISVWGGKVVSTKDATSKKDRCVVLEVGQFTEDTAATPNPNNMPISAPLGIYGNADRREFETDDYEEDDIVAYTYSEADNEIKDILYLLEPVEGSLTRRYAGKSVVLDGDTYTFGKNVSFSLPNYSETDLSNKSEYIVYLDDNGYALWIEESEFTVDQYALIERIWIENNAANDVLEQILTNGAPGGVLGAGGVPGAGASTSAPRARLRLSNGAQRTVTLNESKAYRDEAVDTIKPEFQAGEIIRFSTASDGTYRLHSVQDASKVDFVWGNSTNSINVQSNVNPNANVSVNAAVNNNTLYGFFVGNNNANARITADSNTRFVINDNGTYKTYTGIRNAPNIYNLLSAADVESTLRGYAYCKGTLAKVVFFPYCASSSTSKDITFLAAPSVSKMVTDDDPIPYFEYNAVIKNNITTVRVAAYANSGSTGARLVLEGIQTGSDGKSQCILLNTTDYNSDDIMTSGSFRESNVSMPAPSQGIKRVSGSTEEIKLYTRDGNGNRTEINETFDDGVRVFFSNLDGDIEEIYVDEIRTDGNDWVYYTKENGDITNMFIQEVDEDTVEAPQTGPFFPDQFVALNTAGTLFAWHYIDDSDIPSINKVANAIQTHPLVLTWPTYNAAASSANRMVFSANGMTITVNLVNDATPQYTLTWGGNVTGVTDEDGNAIASGTKVFQGQTLLVTSNGNNLVATFTKANGSAYGNNETPPKMSFTSTNNVNEFSCVVPALQRVATTDNQGVTTVNYGSLTIN